MRIFAGLIITSATIVLGCAAAQNLSALPRPTTAPTTAPAGALHLLAMGDWGEDTAAQRQVAAAMANDAKTAANPIADVLLLGDNFYFKLTGPNDPRWQTLFEQMYDPTALAVPFYASLGNHDYDGNNLQFELAYARQHAESRFKLPDAWYRVDLPKEHPLVTVLMLDSNKDNLSDLQWNRQTEWLKDQLAGPRAPWTVCCAHHPLFSNGFFWGNGVLQKDWGALFQKYHVDLYLAGHEHDMEHLEIPDWFTSFVVAGGGGAHAQPLSRDDRGFSREAFGFLDIQITRDEAIVNILGTDGKSMHTFNRTKTGKVQVTFTTPNTPRTNPLKAYLDLKARNPAASQP